MSDNKNKLKDIGLIVGRSIKYFRTKLGIHQDEIARVLGLDQSMISRIETGKRKLTAEELFVLATLFKVPVDELYVERDDADLD